MSKIDKIKSWYYAINNSSSNASARGISNADWRAGEPLWEKTKSFTLEGKYVTPVGYYPQNLNTDKFIYKFLITSENSEGTIAMLWLKKLHPQHLLLQSLI